jgi:ADP-heptose:LPS heptosyltransferase
VNLDDPRSLLIIHPGALGDVLLAFPAIASLRTRHLPHHMILLSGSEVGTLLQSCGVVDQTLTTESGDLASLMGGAEQLPVRLRTLLRGSEQVVGWFKDHDGSVRATLQQLGIQRIILETPTPRAGVHQSARFLEALEDARGSVPQSVRLAVPGELRQAGATVLRAIGIQEGQNFVVCHPGSGSVHKCVRPETMVQVLHNFGQRGIMPVIVGGPADEEVLERIRKLSMGYVPVVQQQSLATLAGILVQARLYVGHDSGVTHLAAALHVPTVAIFGPTDPRQWAPLGDHVSVITGPPCSCSGWDQVRDCEEKPCLAVTPEEILKVSFSTLSRYRTVTNS